MPYFLPGRLEMKLYLRPLFNASPFFLKPGSHRAGHATANWKHWKQGSDWVSGFGGFREITFSFFVFSFFLATDGRRQLSRKRLGITFYWTNWARMLDQKELFGTPGALKQVIRNAPFGGVWFKEFRDFRGVMSKSWPAAGDQGH